MGYAPMTSNLEMKKEESEVQHFENKQKNINLIIHQILIKNAE